MLLYGSVAHYLVQATDKHCESLRAVHRDVSFHIRQKVWEGKDGQNWLAKKVHARGNLNCQLQGAGWCSLPALSTQLQQLKYSWILPFSVHKPQERTMKTVFACVLCSLSLWAHLEFWPFWIKTFFWSDLILKRLSSIKALFSLPSPLPHHPPKPTNEKHEERKSQQRLLMPFWSEVCIITILSPFGGGY